ncbi:hypothetical protein FD755_015555 [Muntiacus reevesi]|uniref:Uncharacterized protein n=1 Tax=Muntiacus reevesi TaxID=9886 RepID=A0A5N3XGN0_MUNRE|nr:hypothetical protein FD755_015555 [Muntiacus reevesi]
MAKNKLRGQKSRNVFHITGQKSFKLTMNKAFIDKQKEHTNFSKGLSFELLQKQLVSQ